jgi:hypothetical protein
MNQARNTEQLSTRHRDGSTKPGEYRMNDVEADRAVQFDERTERTEPSSWGADVPYGRAGELPLGCGRFLMKRDHVDIVTLRESSDQGNERGDDSIFT